MRTIALDGAKNLVERSAPDPTAGPGEVCIRVNTVGICGSDIEYYLHNRIGSFIPRGPLVLGHELSGQVVAVGSPVDPSSSSTVPGSGGHGVVVGSRVAIDPSMPCRVCAYCRAGRHNLCTNLKFIGTAATVPHLAGGFAGYVVVPRANCFLMPDDISWGEGACLEPVSVAVHAAVRAGSVAGRRVLVSGGGTIGQFVALVARAFGAAVVAVSDPQQHRREFAVSQGGDFGIDPTQPDDMARVREQTGGFDLVFEASGAAPAVRANLELVNRGGTIVQIGSIAGDVELPLNLVMSKELSIVGSFRYADVYPTSMNLLASRRVDVRPLISATYRFADTPAAFALAAERGNAIKIQVEHDG
ncbi:MAG: L-idonate 5-dehydrogenase [Spirochaetaceae bacterium]|nr:MAG: L-idonate 5-dehydrogenase [Spirochaetaceae bacterium]